jgi:hypothetical protein
MFAERLIIVFFRAFCKPPGLTQHSVAQSLISFEILDGFRCLDGNHG